MTTLRVRALALVALPLVAAACGRIGYDRLPIGAGGGPGGNGGGGNGGGGNGGWMGQGNGGWMGQGNGGWGGNNGPGFGGMSGFGGGGWGGGGQGGSMPPMDAGGDGLTPPNDGGGPPASCSQAGSRRMAWSFDTNDESWELSGTGTMTWTGALGDPTPGSLQVDWNTGQQLHPRQLNDLGDLSGRVLTAEIWLDFGADVTVKPFAQTGDRLVWADGGLVTLSPGRWTCLAMDMDNPVFSRQQYDPTDVRIVGFELAGTGPCRIYIDEVAY